MASLPRVRLSDLPTKLGVKPKMKPTTLSIPLVGSNFRPPAREVLSILPAGTSLELRHESDNPYDPNAVAVFVDMGDWPIVKLPLLQDMLGTQLDASELCSRGLMHLGYIARTGNKTTKGGPGNREVLDMADSIPWGLLGLDAKLGLAMEGWPTVVIGYKDMEKESE